MDGKGRRWILLRITMILMCLPTLFMPGHTAQVGATGVTTTVEAGTPMTTEEHNALTRRALNLIGWPRNAHYGFLATWPSDRLDHLVKWMELGFHIDGPWQSDELALVLDVLDSYGATYGESRFSEIVRAAVLAGSGGTRQDLWMVRDNGQAISVAAWYPTAGRIGIWDGLFDDGVLAAHYHWDFLTGPYVHIDGRVDLRHVIIAHEFGHVLAHGLQAEAAAAGHYRTSLEHIYSHFVDPSQRPHGYGSTQESLATEIAVWALGIGRPPEVTKFRNAFLRPTVEGSAWVEEAMLLLAQASAHGAR